MILSSKFAKHWVIWGILMATSIAHSVKIELPLDTIILESNNGKMDKGVKVVNTKGASEGKAVDHEKGNKTAHQIDIPQAGDWYLWIRIFCPDGGKDSYWIGMEKAEPNPAEDALGESAVRIYSAVGDSVNVVGQPFNIWFWDCNKAHADPHSFFKVKKAGKHEFWSKGREPGTLLDQLLLTKDDKFNPEEASKGDWIEIPQAADLNDKLALTWGSIKSFQY